MLAADLLKADDVRIQSDKLRPQDRYAVLEARAPVGPVVQVHEVEGGNAQLDGHLVSPYGLFGLRVLLLFLAMLRWAFILAVALSR
jgi:hypothetical protein